MLKLVKKTREKIKNIFVCGVHLFTFYVHKIKFYLDFSYALKLWNIKQYFNNNNH